MGFSFDVSLQRFLARCPDLRSCPKFAILVEKGRAITAEDLVAVVVDPFFHPSYTIPIVGCFRHLCRQILRRAVAKLQSVSSLEFDNGEDCEEIGKGDMNVIEFYVGRRRGLRLHELACLALCRAVDMAPFLLTYALTYFQFAPAPFRRLLSVEKTVYFSEKLDCGITDVVRVSYRLLLLDPKVFSELWDWSAFLSLLQHITYPQIEIEEALFSNLLDIRWCAIQILSVIMHTNDRIISSFGMRVEDTFMCLLRYEEFCQDTSIEKAGFYMKEAEETYENNTNGKTDPYQHIKLFDDCLYSLDIDAQRSFNNKALFEQKLLDGNFVLTAAVKKSYEMVLMAVSQRWPVLLYGPAGSGKTALIKDLALKSGCRVLFIHIDEQMDIKSLIGSYISSEQPGEFKWQAGSLTQALSGGFWVVFEDIDKAPNEMQSIILPLLEGSRSFVTGHGEVINISERFCLFGTISTSRQEFRQRFEGRYSFSVFWRKVMVQPPSRDDMINIVNATYPTLDFLSSKLVDTLERVNLFISHQIGVCSSISFDRFSLRDLLKWCKRIAGIHFNFSGHVLSLSDSEHVCEEAVDVFVMLLPVPEHRLSLIREITNFWSVSPLGTTLCPSYKPYIQMRQSDLLQVGRITLQSTKRIDIHERRPFVSIRSSLQSLERISCSIKHSEPVLLVGETGTGKTTLVQNLAWRLGHSLIVMNLSQQTDVADLLGGYKPADAQSVCMPLFHEFKELFCMTFSKKDNEALLRHCEIYIIEKKWKRLLHACQKSVLFVWKQLLGKTRESGPGLKRKRPLISETLNKWESFSLRLDCAVEKISASSAMTFKFVEGAFVTALKSGQWLLLDEVNLAPPETLQRIIGVLDGDFGTLCLAERGDVDYVERHPDFRLFACMNPANDAGKRDLPFSFKSRFTEYFIDDVLNDDDLILFVSQYLGESTATVDLAFKIVRFYKTAKKESEERLQDSANQKPQFSLRSLARALEYAKKAEKKFGFKRALYDGFCMFFVTLLDASSATIVHNLILSCLLEGIVPHDIPFDRYFFGNMDPLDSSKMKSFVENYVLTKSVKAHLKNLARAFFIKRYPVLLQGPTSSGKTSLVRYLASISGHEFVRINNHEHTDLQEYFGSYITDSHGRLLFQEGVLVKAVRKGYWIVLDELNLAPSDVLEALNRLLDDNRELFVPELQETIPAHPDFMLFATQNPPNLYGGRKILSRAFRNRFLEIHVDEIPEDELTTILEKRCCIPASYALKMVEVMKDLQLQRQSSKVFAGKHGFITPRDLFRWANRYRIFGRSYEDLAKDGFFLLAERLREDNEKNVVREVLERRLNVKLQVDNLYKASRDEADTALMSAEQTRDIGDLTRILWTQSMWRLYFLIERCYQLREPVLLIGDTGGGKTTVCQLLSVILRSRLHILNCHQYTETSDFVGGFHPVRERPRLVSEFKQYIGSIKETDFFLHLFENHELSSDISQASLTLLHLNKIEASYKENPALHPNITQANFEIFENIKLQLVQLHQKWQTIFIWQDGPLVQGMKAGDLFLVDEISLADDSVLERLNSVLEPERKLLLAEKGGSTPETVTAHPNFFILATMNPGGDYGKKELSPALRNRFTEIWVPPVDDPDELKCIALERLYRHDLSYLVNCMVNFWQWFSKVRTGRMLTVRDLLSWISFINITEGRLGVEHAFLHGAFLVLLDGLSLGTCMLKSEAILLRNSSLDLLIKELKESGLCLGNSRFYEMENYGWGNFVKHDDLYLEKKASFENYFGIDPFFIDKGQNHCKQDTFEFTAPTTRRNALRVLRAMQLSRPVLLEGSPGVGKTSLVVALAQHSGHTVTRINLSEQTDMMDLLGSDLPADGETGIDFSWVDGILLQALKNGYWVLLDELNLAPQSVLEGLNAILDHRAEVYIPELGQTFKCPASFRVFACQNPSSQGGGRKGLPKSFLNRFTKVYVDELGADDYLFICQSIYPSIPASLLSKLITFNTRLYEDTMIRCKYGQDGSPWEFNLRDVIRSCEIMQGISCIAISEIFLNVVYLQRMRSAEDRREVIKLYEEIFGVHISISQVPEVHINPQYLVIGSSCLERNHCQAALASKNQLYLLPGFLQSLEAITHCIQRQWLCILVGPSSSGKTSMLRLLAQLTGNVLNELNLSSGTDVSELLGCFEQFNLFRNYKAAVCQIERFVDEYFSLGLELNWKDFIHERKNLFITWFSFLSSHKNSKFSTFSSSLIAESSSNVDILIEIIRQIQHDFNVFSLPVSYSSVDLDKSLKAIQVLQKNWLMQLSAKFEWVSGNLVNAIEHGEWVVLDNANLCNPTVLDRINSLVEPNGSITINECGLIDGKPFLLNSHSRFRMFITIDPKYGEISRAMRNRGVEIFMHQPEYPSEELTSAEDIEVTNAKRLLVLSGIPLDRMVLAMCEAHLSARAAGLSLGVRITLLELTRWVQLFQQLIMKGNDPIWALQLSWEHTYIAALGELGGREVVMQGNISYLSSTESYNLDPILGYSLALPGGWPLPYLLRNFVHYSREYCVRQNCLYLEFLASRCASYCLNDTLKCSLGSEKPLFLSVLSIEMMHQDLFPNVGNDYAKPEFDLAQANQMMFFAANWATEQAIESNSDLYNLWFRWCHKKMQPYCYFFDSFCMILEQERDHPIWKCIRKCRKELLAHHDINIDMQPIPILSPKLANLCLSNSCLLNSQSSLIDAIYCVRLLRHTYRQWNAEMTFFPCEDAFMRAMQPILHSLRKFEHEVLSIIADINDLFQEYSLLLELHILLFENIKISNLEHLSLIWTWIKKKVLKFMPRFFKAADTFLAEDRNLKFVPGWKFDYKAPTLWVHGGHPFVPSSSGIFYKLKQLTRICETLWETPRLLPEEIHKDENAMLDAIISSNADLRRVATEGVSMSVHIANNRNQGDALSLLQLNEIFETILSMVEHEKRCLKSTFKSVKNGQIYMQFSKKTCCAFSQEALCQKSCFDSWLIVLLLFNRRSIFLDINLLLKIMSSTLANGGEDIKPCLPILFQQALDYSLNNSSRSPVDFSPHQTFLWIFDAGSSADSERTKICGLIHEMWFQWHSSLWSSFSQKVKSFPWLKGPVFELFPTRTQILGLILEGGVAIKDYEVNLLKLRVTSRALWQDSPLQSNLNNVLFSLAECLFKQILFVHEKHFDKDVFSRIKALLFELASRDATHEELQTLSSMILSANHAVFSSLMESVMQPLLEELYMGHSLQDFCILGQAWAHIGMLRFHLLINNNGLDPVVKNALKHSWILRRISLLELEKKVRRDCEHHSGKSSARLDDMVKESLQKLEAEEKQAQAKVVFRPEPSKYNKLKLACSNFHQLVESCSTLLKSIRCQSENNIMIEMALNWLATSNSFINRLSEDFSEYIDLAQPIQVAVYEMMLGLSLAISGIVEREHMKKIGVLKIENILAPISFLMQFPKVLAVECRLIMPKTLSALNLKPCENSVPKRAQIFDLNLLNSMIVISSKVGALQETSHLQHQSTICHIICLNVAYTITNSLVLDKDSFMLLDDIFHRFSKFWMNMKSSMKTLKEKEARYYMFRPRSIKLGDVVSADASADSILEFGGDLSTEWNELLKEQEFSDKPVKEIGNVEETWTLIPDTILKGLIQVHNLLFGTGKLIECPSLVTDEERLLLFMDSYNIGTKIIEGFQALSSSILDDNMLPEHLLHVCLESQWSSRSKSCLSYNVYKESNAKVVFKMVEPLTSIKSKVKSFLEEWPDHPSFMKIMEITEKLLNIPQCTPLPKVLPGLQLLASKIQFLQENDSRFFLKDEVQLLHNLILSWQKLEVESWPRLLDEVSEKHEVNAAKLWFPLYGILHRGTTGDAEADNMLTIQSIEEFICTSSVGEFKKRLILLISFHGQLRDGVHLQVYSGPYVGVNLKILYNAFGYYTQFLPRILERIEAGKGNIEKELKQCLKLLSWEHPCARTSMENFKRARQKTWKLIQKYNDVLQEPVMIVLNEVAKLKREIDPAWLKPDVSGKTNAMDLQFPVDLAKFKSAERFLWLGEWISRSNSIFESFDKEKIDKLCLYSEHICNDFMMAWDDGWNALERICRIAAGFSYVWKFETKNLRKRRSLNDLLKVLEKCGLSRYRLPDMQELKSEQHNSSFLQPSYNVAHLVFNDSVPLNNENTHVPRKYQHTDGKCAKMWEASNMSYFNSLSMIQQVYEIQSCFSKDLTLDLVNRLVSYTEHLVTIQRDQRSAAYGVCEQLEKLRRENQSLGSLETDNDCFLSSHQYLVMKHMWQQKHLFDIFLAMSKDMNAFLVAVKNCHVDCCDKIRDEIDIIFSIFDKFTPLFIKSKDELDRHLLNSKGIVTISNECMPFIVSLKMEQLVRRNYHLFIALEETVGVLRTQKGYSESVKESLLNRLSVIICQGIKEMTDFNSAVMLNQQSECDEYTFNELNIAFIDAFENMLKTIVEVFEKLGHADFSCNGVISAENITSWKTIFKSFMADLQLDQMHDLLHETIIAAIQLVECAGIQKHEVSSQVGRKLKHIHLLLALLLDFSNGILFEFLDVHRTISEMANALACIFTLLLSKGFGFSEDEAENTIQGTIDSSGTGMGEGEGLNDVSDQIEDEAQLTGTSEKDVPDSSDKVPGGKEKGIEIDEDFAADALSVSEESENCDDEEEDGEDVNIESKMGETGDKDQIIDEKLWDKENDEGPENSIEKYELGPTVDETDSSGRELTAKQGDSHDVEEPDQFDKNGSDTPSEDQKDISDVENNSNDDMMLDKNDAFEDPTGMQPDEQEKHHEDDDMDETYGSDKMEEGESNSDGSDKENGDNDLLPAEPMDDENATSAEQEGPDTDDNIENKDDKNVELKPTEKTSESDKLDSVEHPQNRFEMLKQLHAPSFTVGSGLEPEMCWSNSNDMNNCVVPSSIPKNEHSNLQLLMPNSSDPSKLASDQSQPQTSYDETKSRCLKETNPFRSIGQAMESWKEKIAVLDDLLGEQSTMPDDMNEDENAAEFRYVSELERSTSQAFGPATVDQVTGNSGESKSCEMELADRNERMKEAQEHSDTQTLRSMNALIPSEKHIADLMETEARNQTSLNELLQNCTVNSSGNVVSFKSSYFNEKILPLVSTDLPRTIDNEEGVGILKENAIADWRRYELSTTRLSQELVEQLRLVMEPTVASRLQGDYKTGKRINMKKVIPYIASHFRKDKIWLRRTKPNKRDYQVVIAIDDSSSMSESNCGAVAIEALVTVCRAMSQVEAGQFAVARFGKKGNIKLLLDFDQFFSGEAGVRMISSLSFNQENTIADEPVVDLLKYLTNMLDAAVAKARSPSGQNPMHQLVLIIADGRFHEKESLRRCVRNVLNSKRMIAFILLDSPHESIVDLMEACFEEQTLTFKKYMNAFPFPHYIVLKNIEALPRTLADLLRQWFELMQSMGE